MMMICGDEDFRADKKKITEIEKMLMEFHAISPDIPVPSGWS